MDDGSYFDIYEHPVYHFIKELDYPPQNVGWLNAGSNGGTCSQAHANKWVARSTVNSTFAYIPPGDFTTFNWNIGDYIVFEFHDPFDLPNSFSLV